MDTVYYLIISNISLAQLLFILCRNDELINLQVKHVKALQVSSTGHPYIEFILVFRKTNKDPTKGTYTYRYLSA